MQMHPGFFDLASIRAIPDGVPLYGPEARVYCGFSGEEIASFCMLGEITVYRSLKVGYETTLKWKNDGIIWEKM